MYKKLPELFLPMVKLRIIPNNNAVTNKRDNVINNSQAEEQEDNNNYFIPLEEVVLDSFCL